MSKSSQSRPIAIGCTLMVLLLSPHAGLSESPQCGAALRRVVGLDYPWFARMAFLQGPVELVATVSRDGRVTEIRTTAGPEPLAGPARGALSKWQFTGCVSRLDDC